MVPIYRYFKTAWSAMFLFNFKGTPSREEHKTVPSVFTTVGSASTGRGLLRSSVSAYKLFYNQIPEQILSSFTFRTAVRCHVGTVQLRHGATLAPYSVSTVKLLYGPVPVPYRGCTLMIVSVDRRQPAKVNVRQSRSPCTVAVR